MQRPGRTAEDLAIDSLINTKYDKIREVLKNMNHVINVSGISEPMHHYLGPQIVPPIINPFTEEELVTGDFYFDTHLKSFGFYDLNNTEDKRWAYIDTVDSMWVHFFANGNFGEGEIFWVQPVIKPFIIYKDVLNAGAVSTIAPLVEFQIDFYQNDIVVGTVHWDAGETVGVITWLLDRYFAPGDVMKAKISIMDTEVKDVGITLEGFYV